jgi:succinate-semialdehyde dehydrogenase / glutarate-semialdehyde dehydrogenase
MAATAEHVEVAGETFTSADPRTGTLVGTFPVHSAADVEAAVARARAAAGWWDGIGFAERRRRLFALRGAIARRAPEIAALIQSEMGKPLLAAYVEVNIACEHLAFAARHAQRVLGPRRVRRGPLTVNHRAALEYRPLGVVGAITPWNYPLLIAVADLAGALGAGNAVVLKPSEHAPAVARWLVDRCAEAVPEQPVVELVTGHGETGTLLCRAGVDRIAFTGSAENGRQVLAACAPSLTPASLELGGKDPLIVDEDADLAQAVRVAAFGAFWIGGQSCISIERAYVHEHVYDAFLDRLTDYIHRLATNDRLRDSLGPMATPAQLAAVQRQVEDALERGAKAVVGGAEAIRAPYIDPIVLVDVPDDARIMQEETFGPVLPVQMVRDAEEALARANASAFALGGSVVGQRRAADIARRLRGGACAINGALTYYANPNLPFGGAGGSSGFGWTHGADGLRSFAHPKVVTSRRFGLTRLWPDKLDVDQRANALMPLVARVLYGRG